MQLIGWYNSDTACIFETRGTFYLALKHVVFVPCRVPAFEASRYLISNSEFLEFVKSGGYETRDFWGTDGWQWLQYRQAKHPTFWVCPEGMPRRGYISSQGMMLVGYCSITGRNVCFWMYDCPL